MYIQYLCALLLGFRPYGGSLFPTAEKVTKKAVLLVGFLLRRNTLTPTTLRGPAPNGHPCPDGALAASMPLGPLRVVCVQPAPKSRFVGFKPFAYEDQKQRRAKAKASRLKPVPLKAARALSSLIVPTLRVVMPPRTLRVLHDVHQSRYVTRSVTGCIPTRSVGTINLSPRSTHSP